MSYILDALKKAEAERERGTVPGLATNQANSTLVIVREGVHPAWWLAAVLLATALAYGFWPAGVTPAVAPQPSPVLPAPAQAVTPVVASAPVSVPVAVPVPVAIPATASAWKPAPVATPATTTAPPPAPVATLQAKPVTTPAPAANTRLAPLPATAQTPSVSTPVAALPAAPLPTATAANRPPAGAQPLPALADLPETLRRQMPALTISGAVYSDSPPEWALVVNDQVLGRGGMVAPELRLEEVSANSAVFSFKGQRFRMDR